MLLTGAALTGNLLQDEISVAFISVAVHVLFVLAYGQF